MGQWIRDKIMEMEPKAVDEQLAQPEAHEEQHGAPRGAFLFVMLMLLGYVVYWIFMYAEVVIQRSSGA